MPPIMRLLSRRTVLAVIACALTLGLGAAASRVRPDYSIENIFPRFDQSRVDYERFKKDFPFEDARALVVVEADDLFTQSGLERIAKLEADLASVPGVLDTQSLMSARNVTSDGVSLRMEKLFPSLPITPEQLQEGERIATTDPLFRYHLAHPDGRSTVISVTLTTEVASNEESRTAFWTKAREVVQRHSAQAEHGGIKQRLTLNGLPIIRSEFTAMVGRDLATLFPLAMVVVLLLLYVAFRRIFDVFCAWATILASIVWTTGAMGLIGVPMQALTQATPIVVMIVSISDTVHVVTHARELAAAGMPWRQAVLEGASSSFVPCLLTELTIAGGFLALAANDMEMIQQFGLVTAIGMLLTWLANFTLLPVLLSLGSHRASAAEPKPSWRRGARFIAAVERVVTTHPRRTMVIACVIALGLAASIPSVGKEYYSYDDLRPTTPLYKDLRYVEATTGGSVPMAIFVEPENPAPGAMLEPSALSLIDRVTQKLETEYSEDVKSAASLSKLMRKAHSVLLGEELARDNPLPDSRKLAAQELLAIDDTRTLRDVVSFDRGTAAIFAMMPDRGSSHATRLLEKLRKDLSAEAEKAGYKLTVTGIFGIADGIYRNLVGGLFKSLALAVLVSFFMFWAVLRSWRLAVLALVPNLAPLLVTVGAMSLLSIDIKPSTVIVFSITLVIADDDTIQFLARFRRRFREVANGVDPHRTAVVDTLRTSGVPMLVTSLAISLGFSSLIASEFVGLANLGLLLAVSLLSAVAADLFLTPVLLIGLKPKIA